MKRSGFRAEGFGVEGSRAMSGVGASGFRTLNPKPLGLESLLDFKHSFRLQGLWTRSLSRRTSWLVASKVSYKMTYLIGARS